MPNNGTNNAIQRVQILISHMIFDSDQSLYFIYLVFSRLPN